MPVYRFTLHRRAQGRAGKHRAPSRRSRTYQHALGVPLLAAGLLTTTSIPTPEIAAVELASAEVGAPTMYQTEPVTVLKASPKPKPKPKPKPAGWVAPVNGYHLTARFGASSGLWARTHTGLDFAAPSGSPIRSIAAGVVTEAGWDGAYGQRTVVRLPDGTELWYCHQSTVDVSVGQRVTAGHVLGTVGSTGNVTGPHLHLEVRPSTDQPVDPYTALARHGVRV
jgi:murein DD-endopeptidase MepM/ murein hydrolase activator NlpD